MRNQLKSKPKSFNQYVCPHGKYLASVGEGKDVTGRFCKNNCSMYAKGTCSKWYDVKNPIFGFIHKLREKIRADIRLMTLTRGQKIEDDPKLK